MSYNQEELISIFNSIVEICSNSDTLKLYTDAYCDLWQKFDNLKQKYDSFMEIVDNLSQKYDSSIGIVEKSEVKEIVSAEFTDLEQLVMSNVEESKDICLEHKDDKEFHPPKKEFGNLLMLFNETHDRIVSFEVLLKVFQPTGR